MQFVIAVYTAPLASKGAYQFAQAVISQQNIIQQIFFMQSGVLNARKNTANLDWMTLKSPCKICISAGIKKHVTAKNLLPGFELSTLTQFFQALDKSDRYIVFAD